MLILIHNNIQ